MTLIIIIIAAGLLLGIIFLKSRTPGNKIDREDFLAKVEDYVEGERKAIKGLGENSYKIDFTFEGGKYAFEDTFVDGFQGDVRKVHLKYFMDNEFTLNFTEKQVSGSVRSDLLMASDVPTEIVDKGPKIDPPKELEEFIIQTNDVGMANKLLADKKAVSVLMGYKNTDNRGRPFFSLKIIGGNIVLHFHASSILKPSLPVLQGDIPTIENHIDNIMVIADKLK